MNALYHERRVEHVNSFDGRAARFQAGTSELDRINVVFGHLKFESGKPT